ncbi:MAG: hypothetical protein COC23_04640 [Hyphomicrobiales bacterium]|nr:MAG: hypothetical protein COC23_04640 [Hyphomicrobiales bacterium]
MASSGTSSLTTIGKTEEKPENLTLSEALARLNSALDGLDAAAGAAIEARNISLNTNEQVQRMAEDRSKLARDLDSSEVRAKLLKDVNNEVSRRIVGAMETVRTVLDNKA